MCLSGSLKGGLGMYPLISVRDVTHSYNKGENDEVMALKNISLEISEGEFIAIVGANGSGKSTLAKHLNALLLPTSGSITIAGYDVEKPDNVWEIRSTVGMVFQNPDNQIVATTIEEDVAFGPENLGVEPEEINRRIDEALQTVNMEQYRRHAPHLLSGGQKQRVAIAGVLAMRPRCIVFDEATSMLDPGGRKEVMETVKRLNRDEHITIAYITHFMDEAVQADRVVVMEDGRIVLDGTPKEVFADIERIRQLGLDVPQATDLAVRLHKRGLNVNPDVLDTKELVNKLCQL